MKVSIITPVFNEAKNIESCFNCVVELEYGNIEWIIVDDGSTDETIDLLNAMVSQMKIINDKKTLNIKILKQANSGASAARKNGIDNSTGDLITILDCDDRLSADALCKSIVKFQKSDDVDLVFYDISYITDNLEKKRFDFAVNSWPISGYEAFTHNIAKWGLPGFFIAKREIFFSAYKLKKNISVNNVNDDELISKYCLVCAKKIERGSGVYYYVENLNSTTRRINKNYHRIIYTAIEMDCFIRANGFDDEILLKSNINLQSVFYGVFMKFLEGRKIFDVENKKEWNNSLQLISSYINIHPKKFYPSYTSYIKSNVKFYLSKILVVVCKYI